MCERMCVRIDTVTQRLKSWRHEGVTMVSDHCFNYLNTKAGVKLLKRVVRVQSKVQCYMTAEQPARAVVSQLKHKHVDMVCLTMFVTLTFSLYNCVTNCGFRRSSVLERLELLYVQQLGPVRGTKGTRWMDRYQSFPPITDLEWRFLLYVNSEHNPALTQVFSAD